MERREVACTGKADMIPTYRSEGAAGADLKAALETDLVLKPGERAIVPTGIALEVPQGFEAQIRPRSGLAAGAGITVLNTPGTVDSDYRGEVKVILINLGSEAYAIRPGDRIAQVVLAPVARASFVRKESIHETGRGKAGFGSTGV